MIRGNGDWLHFLFECLEEGVDVGTYILRTRGSRDSLLMKNFWVLGVERG